ncbi:hypothetical protein [Stackebrandtia endophytica]|uniref:hypothetical protein n=1 Tax=Stackebrandtia endophytica TaxID=1496996 RepID=UPI001476E4A2|nr:hypothetical protein [Stackebrandtia endophytica]
MTSPRLPAPAAISDPRPIHPVVSHHAGRDTTVDVSHDAKCSRRRVRLSFDEQLG